MNKFDFIITGLGNPGKEYEKTRHNAGFMALDKIAAKLGISWQRDKKNKIVFGEFLQNGRGALLIKPQGFMNKSGEVIKKFLDYRNIRAKELEDKLVIVSDDADMNEGALKIIKQSGHGGHKGVINIFQVFNSDNFWRIKIGVRPRANQERSEIFVLGRFLKDNPAEKRIAEMPEIFNCLMSQGPGQCQDLFN
ncbi:MAG: aminoacyl-tRNA hydrolase [Patescibacteria group bacterium]|nr:aminoacyl-tRNA hydrolase [Patescibacteria group bacterium]